MMKQGGGDEYFGGQKKDYVYFAQAATLSAFYRRLSHHLNYGNKCLQKFYCKNNGRNEIFEKNIHGKEVSHDRAKPLLG